MRPSTIFGIAIAVLLGLGVVVVAKLTGVFSPTPPAQQRGRPKILVAKQNLFPGIRMSGREVTLRDMYPHEYQLYRDDPKEFQKKYLPPLREAVVNRVPLVSIPADRPIARSDLEPLEIPPGTSARLKEGMRAVNISVPRERAAGGLIRTGEHVDVLLTTEICTDPQCRQSTLRSARIAKDLRVIIKRDSLWTLLAPIPEDRPVRFTLEANPYRAALIEFAKLRGLLTLVPTSKDGDGSGIVTGAAVNSEFGDEKIRVAKFKAGETTVGEDDLARIFGVRPQQIIPIEPPYRVERLSGVRKVGVSTFAKDSANQQAETKPLVFRIPGNKKKTYRGSGARIP